MRSKELSNAGANVDEPITQILGPITVFMINTTNKHMHEILRPKKQTLFVEGVPNVTNISRSLKIQKVLYPTDIEYDSCFWQV